MVIMRKRKITKNPSFQALNFDDLKWCIDNDFQVYLVPLDSNGKGGYKIAVRRGGITTGGRDEAIINGSRVISNVTLSDLTFKNHMEAHNQLNYVYKHLRDKYGV